MLKHLREQRGMTQEQLAKRSGVSQGYIAKLEPASRPRQKKRVRQANPSITTLKKLARALDVPVTELLK